MWHAVQHRAGLTSGQSSFGECRFCLLQALAHVILSEPVVLCRKVPGTSWKWWDLLQEGLIHVVYAVRTPSARYAKGLDMPLEGAVACMRLAHDSAADAFCTCSDQEAAAAIMPVLHASCLTHA